MTDTEQQLAEARDIIKAICICGGLSQTNSIFQKAREFLKRTEPLHPVEVEAVRERIDDAERKIVDRIAISDIQHNASLNSLLTGAGRILTRLEEISLKLSDIKQQNERILVTQDDAIV